MTEADRALVVRRIAKFELTPQSPCFVLSTIPSAIDLVDFIGNVPLKKRLNSLSFILPQLLRAVAYLHRAGVGHGDLKLDNFLIGPGNSPRVLLIDFDRSVIYNKEPYGIPYGGTPGYIPPEYYNNNPDLSKPPIVNLQLYDSWQLGCIFYVFLTNKLPYGFESTSKGSLSPLNPAVHFAAMEKLLKTKKHTYPPVKYPFTDLPLVEKMRLYVLEMSMKRLMTIDVRQRYTPERLLDSNLFNLQKAAMRQ
ncbi:kinase-like domain-containing protein [Syncephalis fuscata]|nr:kinase-like domain-containing protein [Syncephalis fuscata]